MASVAGGSFTYYRSTMVYGGTAGTDEQLLYVMHPEGVVVKHAADNGFDWQYHLTDYMGNVRTVALADVNGLVPIQSTDYYAFGLAHGYENLHLNRYLFSGKELQDANVGDLGFLSLYDYGARFYDPLLGRWHNIDPALQFTNPYMFCNNAPMVYIDPDGRFIFSIINGIKDLFKNIGDSIGEMFDGDGRGPGAWDWHSTKMAWKIDAGMFKGNFGQVLSRWTWELSQTLIGYSIAQVQNLCDGVESVSYYGGATAVEFYAKGWGAFTLGSYINGNHGLYADPFNNSLFQHEYGHYRQSQAAGPIYLYRYALPSLWSTIVNSDNHDFSAVEQDANARAMKYFEKRHPGFVDDHWFFEYNPLTGYDEEQPFNSDHNQDALRDAKVSAYSLDLGALPWNVLTFGLVDYQLQKQSQKPKY